MIKIKLSKIPNFPNLNQILDKKVFIQLGKQVTKDIISRTKSGKDVNNQLFIPYAKTNKKKRNKRVDLTDTGRMLNDIGYSAQDGYSEIEIKTSRSKRVAQYNQNRQGYQRKFFGLGNKEVQYIRQKLVTILRKGFK